MVSSKPDSPRRITVRVLADRRGVARSFAYRELSHGGSLEGLLGPDGRVDASHPHVIHWIAKGPSRDRERRARYTREDILTTDVQGENRPNPQRLVTPAELAALKGCPVDDVLDLIGDHPGYLRIADLTAPMVRRELGVSLSALLKQARQQGAITAGGRWIDLARIPG